MNKNLSPTGIILDILGDLEIPLMKPISTTADGYELMISYPKEKKLTKDILSQELSNKGLVIVDIDVFRERGERYAWVVVLVPESTITEKQNG